MLKEKRAEKYVSFRETDFAADAYFLQWRLLQDKETEDFWQSYRKQHPEKEREIQRAISIVKSVRLTERRFTEEEKKREIGKLMHFVRIRKRRSRVRMYAAAAAAALVAVGVVAAAYLYPAALEEKPAYTYVVPDNQEIRLIAADSQVVTVADQSQIICGQDGSIAVEAGEEKGWLPHSEEAKETACRKLVVPNGKRASLRLADGTQVWVNSGTTLEFPVAFAEECRHIKVEGEIYLEVAENKEVPFIVSSPQFEVKVLGTKFGISAYAQMEEQNVVLLEGSVQVSTSSGYQVRLSPSQLFSLEDGVPSMKSVDPYGYVSWKDDVLYFNGESLQEVFFRLSKQYAVDIVCNADVRSVRLYGRLILQEHIEEALDNIAVLSPIKYSVQNNKIIVDKVKE